MLQQLDGSLHFQRRASGGEETGLSMIEPVQRQGKPFFLGADPEAQKGSPALEQRKRFLYGGGRSGCIDQIVNTVGAEPAYFSFQVYLLGGEYSVCTQAFRLPSPH